MTLPFAAMSFFGSICDPVFIGVDDRFPITFITYILVILIVSRHFLGKTLPGSLRTDLLYAGASPESAKRVPRHAKE
jgi:hypothetical protein